MKGSYTIVIALTFQVSILEALYSCVYHQEILTAIIVAHSDVVSNHMGHCAAENVRLVGINIDGDPRRFRGADRFRHANAHLAALKALSSATRKIVCDGRVEFQIASCSFQ